MQSERHCGLPIRALRETNVNLLGGFQPPQKVLGKGAAGQITSNGPRTNCTKLVASTPNCHIVALFRLYR